MGVEIFEKIAKISLEKFDNLPKTGKPKNEWTVLSCIIKEENQNFLVVALGTGSKCIGKSKMSSKGDILNDSHAEIICRRAFLLYLYEQIENNLGGRESIFKFNMENGKFVLNNSRFHFFTTLMPCGDASIFPKSFEHNGDFIGESLNAPKRMKLNDGDIFRTGAKCFDSDVKQDPKGEGANFHITGATRRKPGRGEPTLSVSCSDKLAKWGRVGIQGALLNTLIDKPIYLSTFTVAGGTPFSANSLKRAIYSRFEDVQLGEPFQVEKMEFHQVQVEFTFQKSDSKEVSSTSIIWFQSLNPRKAEVGVDGIKQGVTKKNKNTKSARLCICKKELFKKFMFVCDKMAKREFIGLNYVKCKEAAELYQSQWCQVKKLFGVWPEKDKTLLEFTVDD